MFSSKITFSQVCLYVCVYGIGMFAIGLNVTVFVKKLIILPVRNFWPNSNLIKSNNYTLIIIREKRLHFSLM